ncbi:putative dsRNA-binding protein, partial [Chlamydiia bacterium]|nr:putative dsRNA-binding protein [Chlamydiia bacterium]
RENWKAKLQEYFQQDGAILPQYRTINESGPEHNKEFTVSVSLDDNSHSEQGMGSSKKEAEQEAAKKLFNFLNNIKGL